MKLILVILIILFSFTAHAEYTGENHTDIKPWQDMLAREPIQPCVENGAFCYPLSWQPEIEYIEKLTLLQRIGEANKYINTRYPYKVVTHQWQSPSELNKSGFGDCKDLAIAKFAILVAAGVDPKIMRIMVVRDTKGSYIHAVLIVRLGKEFYYLDTQPANFRQYKPIYSINLQGWCLHDKNFINGD